MSNLKRRGICWVSINHPYQKLYWFAYALAFVSNFECLDIQVKSYGRLIFPLAFVFHLERLDMLWASIGNSSQKLLQFGFSSRLHVQFQASRYIMDRNQMSSQSVWARAFARRFHV